MKLPEITSCSQPEWIQKVFPNGGYFIEAGAHDGIGDSNTWPLEQTGKWNGLCVEPSSYFEGLRLNRNCLVSPAVLGIADNQPVQFANIEGGELSGITKYFKDKWDRSKVVSVGERFTTCLDTLLFSFNAPRDIEYMCLDVEGAESQVLFGLRRHKIKVICIEHNSVQVNQEGIFELMTAVRGYQQVYSTATEDWYVLRELLL